MQMGNGTHVFNGTFSHMSHDHPLGKIPGLQYFFVGALAFQSVFGTFGNFLVIGAVCTMPALRTPSNYFIVNLAISDLLVTCVTQPSNILGALLGEIWFLERPIFCTVISTLCATGCISSTFNICMIAINRYILICHYPYYDRIYTKWNTILMCVVVWVCIYSIQLPNHLGWGDTRFSTVFYVCTFANHVHTYAIFYVMVGVILPVVVSFLAYVGIFIRVKDSNLVRNRILDASKQEGQKQDTNQAAKKKMSLRMFHENVKMARALFRVYVIFILMWLPVAIVILMGKGSTIHPVWYLLTVLMAHGNSSINFLVYAASLDHFQDGYYRLLGIRRRRSASKARSSKEKTGGSVEMQTKRTIGFSEEQFLASSGDETSRG